MFTGIIEQVGKIDALERSKDGASLRISFTKAWAGAHALKIGGSISVNGCCLTAVTVGKRHFEADLSGETLLRTSFSEAKPGTHVNLERPLPADGRLGGHFVQGHVDAAGRVARLVQEGGSWWLSVRLPEECRCYVAEKGSLAIDGISLTVARWREGVADFAIIPFTYENTNIHALTVEDAVNIECDILAKYVEALRQSRDGAAIPRLTVAQLREQGF